MNEMSRQATQRKTIRDLVVKHPLLIFLLLAFTISWVGVALSDWIDLGLANGFGVIGSISPALAALVVSACRNPGSSGLEARKRWRLFGILVVLALAIMACRRLWVTPEWLVIADTRYATVPYPNVWAVVIDLLAAGLVALILSGVLSSKEGVHGLLDSLDLRKRPVRWYWWFIAMGIYPLVNILGNAVSALMGQPVQIAVSTPFLPGLAVDLFLTFCYFMIGGGGLEEVGWRGFVLPYLQKGDRPLRATIILAIFWALWHLPFLWFGGLQGSVVNVVLGLGSFFLVGIIPYALLFTAVFNRTGGSLPIAIVLHTSINVTSTLFQPATAATNILWLVFSAVLLIWMWRAPQTFAYRNSTKY